MVSEGVKESEENITGCWRMRGPGCAVTEFGNTDICGKAGTEMDLMIDHMVSTITYVGRTAKAQLLQSQSLLSSTFLSPYRTPSNGSPSGASNSSRCQQAWHPSSLLNCHPAIHTASISFCCLPSAICLPPPSVARLFHSDTSIVLIHVPSSLYLCHGSSSNPHYLMPRGL